MIGGKKAAATVYFQLPPSEKEVLSRNAALIGISDSRFVRIAVAFAILNPNAFRRFREKVKTPNTYSLSQSTSVYDLYNKGNEND